MNSATELTNQTSIFKPLYASDIGEVNFMGNISDKNLDKSTQSLLSELRRDYFYAHFMEWLEL